jgi:hypothetical protein
MKWSRDHVLIWGFMINVDLTDLLTVIEFTLDTKHSTPDCICTNFRSIAGVVTKRALLMDPDEL